jgi:HK97 family phage major capsid protein
MPNAYLERLRAQYDAARTTASGLQETAAAANRDLSEDELRQVTEAVATCQTLLPQITSLTEQEQRNAAAGSLAASIEQARTDAGQTGHNANGTAGGDQGGAGEQRREAEVPREYLRALESMGFRPGRPDVMTRARYYAHDRDPGHYRSTLDGGQRSFFGDIWSAQQGNEESITRLREHNRAAVVTSGGGTGLVAPHWLVEEFELMPRQTRSVASKVRKIPLGGDPRPLTLPKQTNKLQVTVQLTEGLNNQDGSNGVTANAVAGGNSWGTGSWTTNVDTATPKPYSAYVDVSRQMLDMATPAIDQLIYGDLQVSYDQSIELLVVTTMVAAASVSGGVIANDSLFTAGTAAGAAAVRGAVVDGETYILSNRFAAPDLMVVSVTRFGQFRKLNDSTGRPLMPMYNPFNAAGEANAASLLTGAFEGVAVAPTTSLVELGSYPRPIAVLAVSQDTVLFEDAIQQFRFEEVVGPADVRLGIWNYAAAITRHNPTGSANSATGTATIAVTAA